MGRKTNINWVIGVERNGDITEYEIDGLTDTNIVEKIGKKCGFRKIDDFKHIHEYGYEGSTYMVKRQVEHIVKINMNILLQLIMNYSLGIWG